VPLTYAKPIAAKPGFSFVTPASLWEVRTNDPASGQDIQHGVSAKLTIPLNGAMTLNSLTAWRGSNHHFFIDADLTEQTLQTTDYSDVQHQTSQELTLVRHTATLTWIGGAFFFDEYDRQPVELTLFTPGLQYRPYPRITAAAWALFGQATYRVSSRVSLTGGLRYTDEQKDFENSGGLYKLGTTVLGVPSSFYSYADRASSNAWTPKVGIDLQAARDVFVYVSATRGFKSGGFNPSTPVPGRAYNPEFAWSYEGGLKTTIAGGRVRVNTAMFYTDYRDLQVQAFSSFGVLDISNAASAAIKGVEVEAAVRPAESLQLATSFSWLDATYRRYIAAGAGGITQDAAGHRLNNAPGWSGNQSAVYHFTVGRGGTASMRGDVSWQSRVFFTAFNDDIETQRAHALVNLRAGFEPRRRRWEIAVYARNVGNSEYITGTASFPVNAIGGRPGDPRHWGTQFTLRY
jgi:iron complex outermembrane receptor protein